MIATFQSPGPEIFQIGPFALRWYGALIAMSVFTGLRLSSYLAKKKNLDYRIINDILPLLVCSALIGARVYYVVFEWKNYKNNWLEVFAIWKGGIAIHGALIGGVIAILLFCKLNRLQFWKFLDVIIPSVALGQAIGRWGNFFNNEAFGIPTELPWKLFIPFEYRPSVFSSEQYFHPTFLYESLWNFLIFILLILIFRSNIKKSLTLHAGSISCIYIFLYSVGRLWIESLRIDPLCIASTPPFCEGGIKIAQLMSLLLSASGLFGLFRLYVQKKELPNFTKK